MPPSTLTAEDVATARRAFEEFQETHDLSERVGQIAGIDPATGEVSFGNWITDIVTERKARGRDSPLYFVRVGSPTFLRKGGRR